MCEYKQSSPNMSDENVIYSPKSQTKEHIKDHIKEQTKDQTREKTKYQTKEQTNLGIPDPGPIIVVENRPIYVPRRRRTRKQKWNEALFQQALLVEDRKMTKQREVIVIDDHEIEAVRQLEQMKIDQEKKIFDRESLEEREKKIRLTEERQAIMIAKLSELQKLQQETFNLQLLQDSANRVYDAQKQLRDMEITRQQVLLDQSRALALFDQQTEQTNRLQRIADIIQLERQRDEEKRIANQKMQEQLEEQKREKQRQYDIVQREFTTVRLQEIRDSVFPPQVAEIQKLLIDQQLNVLRAQYDQSTVTHINKIMTGIAPTLSIKYTGFDGAISALHELVSYLNRCGGVCYRIINDILLTEQGKLLLDDEQMMFLDTIKKNILEFILDTIILNDRDKALFRARAAL